MNGMREEMDRHERLLSFAAVTEAPIGTPCEGVVHRHGGRPCRLAAKYHYASLPETNGCTGNYCGWHLISVGTAYDAREPLAAAALKEWDR